MSLKLKPHYDLVISGGGPVGLSLALGAARLGLEVLVAEKTPVKEVPAPSFDGRMLALNLSSMRLFAQIGLEDVLRPFLTPIEHVHVSQQRFMGVTTLHAEAMGLSALGYSVLGQALGKVLAEAVSRQARITLLQPAALTAFEQQAEHVKIKLHTERGELDTAAALLVGADGTHSVVRQQLGWAVEKKDYGSVAILAQVESYLPHRHWAYERFTHDGPVALLPYKTHHHKAVMVVPAEKQPELMALDDSAYLRAFTQRMGARFGGFKAAGARLVYPLQAFYVDKVAQGRVALMGNASHTQHPVAAQGLNLGLRDVADYLSFLAQEQRAPCEWLAEYEQKRQRDHRAVMGMTDSLIDLFQVPQPLAGHLRGMGLIGLELLPMLKRRVAQFGMEG